MKNKLITLILIALLVCLLPCLVSCDNEESVKNVEVSFHCGDTYEVFVDGMNVFCVVKPDFNNGDIISIDKIRYYGSSQSDMWTDLTDTDKFAYKSWAFIDLGEGQTELHCIDEETNNVLPRYKIERKGTYWIKWMIFDATEYVEDDSNIGCEITVTVQVIVY